MAVSQNFRGDELFEPVLKNTLLLTKLGIGGISAVKGLAFQARWSWRHVILWRWKEAGGNLLR